MRVVASSKGFQTLTDEFPILLLDLRHGFHEQFVFFFIKSGRSDLLCSLELAHGAVFFVELAWFEDLAAVHGYQWAVAFVAIVHCGACHGAYSSCGNTVGIDDFGDLVKGHVFFLTEGVDFLILWVGFSFQFLVVAVIDACD